MLPIASVLPLRIATIAVGRHPKTVVRLAISGSPHIWRGSLTQDKNRQRITSMASTAKMRFCQVPGGPGLGSTDMKERAGELSAALLAADPGSVLDVMQPFIFQCQVMTVVLCFYSPDI